MPVCVCGAKKEKGVCLCVCVCVCVCVELGRKKVCAWSSVQYFIPGCISDFKVLQKQQLHKSLGLGQSRVRTGSSPSPRHR